MNFSGLVIFFINCDCEVGWNYVEISRSSGKQRSWQREFFWNLPPGLYHPYIPIFDSQKISAHSYLPFSRNRFSKLAIVDSDPTSQGVQARCTSSPTSYFRSQRGSGTFQNGYFDFERSTYLIGIHPYNFIGIGCDLSAGETKTFLRHQKSGVSFCSRVEEGSGHLESSDFRKKIKFSKIEITVLWVSYPVKMVMIDLLMIVIHF